MIYVHPKRDDYRQALIIRREEYCLCLLSDKKFIKIAKKMGSPRRHLTAAVVVVERKQSQSYRVQQLMIGISIFLACVDVSE